MNETLTKYQEDTMSLIESIHLAPDYFYVKVHNNSRAYAYDTEFHTCKLISYEWSDEYLVGKHLYGHVLVDLFVEDNNTLSMIIDEDEYRVYNDSKQRQRVFSKTFDGCVIAKDKQWTMEQILAQKMGTLVDFLVEYTQETKPDQCREFQLIPYVTINIKTVPHTKLRKYKLHYLIEITKVQSFTNRLRQTNGTILKENIIRPQLVKLL